MLEFLVLGPVEAVAHGSCAVLHGRHQRTLLAVLLAASGRTVTTDRLIDALWGEDPPVSARKSLQSHLARLRGALADLVPDGASGTDIIVSEPGGYRLPPDDRRLDARAFEDTIGQARALLADDPSLAIQTLDDALGLVRGPAYGELASHPAVTSEAFRLERLRATAAADRVDLMLVLGRHAEVLGDLEPAMTRDPPDEAELFQRLSVFAGPFSLPATEAVCAGDGLDPDVIAGLVGNLVDRSMVIVERRGGRLRYRLLDTLREFGGRRLDAAGRTEGSSAAPTLGTTSNSGRHTGHAPGARTSATRSPRSTRRWTTFGQRMAGCSVSATWTVRFASRPRSASTRSSGSGTRSPPGRAAQRHCPALRSPSTSTRPGPPRRSSGRSRWHGRSRTR